MGESDTRFTPPSGMNTWRAGCGESRTSGSEGGPEKPSGSKDARALRSDPYTYIRTWQGWLYLAVVMDLFSRKIVGWAAGPTIRRELVLDAVLMTVRRRRPRGTMIHSDQGTQYGSDAWRRFCRSNHLEPSVSRKANCWDNAVAESFFVGGHVKVRNSGRVSTAVSGACG